MNVFIAQFTLVLVIMECAVAQSAKDGVCSLVVCHSVLLLSLWHPGKCVCRWSSCVSVVDLVFAVLSGFLSVPISCLGPDS